VFYNRSFDGSAMHGTMLPSTVPLPFGRNADADSAQSRPPPRVSNGSHLTATRANKEAAESYHTVRQVRTDIYNHWKK